MSWRGVLNGVLNGFLIALASPEEEAAESISGSTSRSAPFLLRVYVVGSVRGFFDEVVEALVERLRPVALVDPNSIDR
jgi:hypothetical protein